MAYISLGTITRPFGIKGEVRLKPHNPQTEWFDNAEGIWVRRDDQDPEYIPLVRARWHKDCLVLTLEGVADRNRAEEMRGLDVVADQDQRTL